MFNLIVSGSLDDGRRGSMFAGRVLEFTEPEIIARLMPNRALDIPVIQRLPTIFMNEGTDDEIATVGWIEKIDRRVEGYKDEYRFEYRRDTHVPLITNADILEMKDDLGIDRSEFSRNHWAIKDSDLFRALLARQTSRLPRPTVFHLSDRPIVPNRISIMMPFDARYSPAYLALKSAIEVAGFECHRADDFWLHPHIIQDIVELLCTSRVVICDLTNKNPNVFYETGIAHTLGKDTILITQSVDDVPFDLRSLRFIKYLNNGEGVSRLADEVVARLRTISNSS